MTNLTLKRKRRLSSISSHLEPATFNSHTEVEGKEPDQAIDLVSRGSSVDLVDTPLRSSSASNSSTIISVSPEKQVKSYERRLRRKTREDRYEIKQAKEVKMQQKEKEKKKKNKEKKRTGAGAAKKERKRNRKEKSGAALMHDFTARNVTRDRLTVRCYDSDNLCQHCQLTSRNSLGHHQPSDCSAKVERLRQSGDEGVSFYVQLGNPTADG